ncbi:MAG: hypothetical protein JXX29_14085 [Deltaproteobacteria bacterium]|nr:hypothetical protein [Deltaproteobacteria bacterium]MBN2672807.1 hypothetical protein [Deltaproteobacteria bacterium]
MVRLFKRLEFLPIVLLLVTVFVVGSASPAYSAQSEAIYIIANNSFPAKSLTLLQAKRIFLKTQTRVGGKAVIPVNARKDSSLRKAFVQRALHMSATEEQRYWQDQKMKAGAQLPPEVGDTVRAVFGIKNGISYCFASQYKADVAQILLKIE